MKMPPVVEYGYFLESPISTFSIRLCRENCNNLFSYSIKVKLIYHVALNFCRSLILGMGDFLSFMGTIFLQSLWGLISSNFTTRQKRLFADKQCAVNLIKN